MVNHSTEIRNKWFRKKVSELEKKGFTLADIAKKLGVYPQYLTPILNGKRNASEKFVLKFCEKFDINLNDLYNIMGNPVGLMADDESTDQDADENVKSGETIPSTVLNHPSYQNLLNKVQELATEIDRLKADNNKLRIQNDLLSDLVKKGLSAKK